MHSRTATIVDYGVGNIYSIVRALQYLGSQGIVSSESQVVTNADYLILPGVGAFGEGMTNIEKRNLMKPLLSFIKSGKPFLGICLGMQLLMSLSEELGIYRGFNVISGKVMRLPHEISSPYKVPHIGWESLAWRDYKEAWGGTILEGVESGEFVYFLHSYIVVPEDTNVVLAETTYGNYTYCSVLKKNNIYGCQFHPEKSGTVGLKILDNFLKS